MKKANEHKYTDVMLADAQLTLSMTAIHTTTSALMDTMCELVIRPNLVSEIRDEIKTVLEAEGGSFTTNALFNMKLLDSVRPSLSFLRLYELINAHCYGTMIPVIANILITIS
jgi:hypothetical protein